MAKISKTSTFEVPKIFSEFSPLRSVRFCLRLGLGPWLPRPNTAAHGSPRRPRFRGRAAPGGEGGCGCREQRRPWPRRRILVGKPHEPWDSVVKGSEGRRNVEVDEMLMVQVFRGFCVSLRMESVPVCQDNFCTNFFCWVFRQDCVVACTSIICFVDLIIVCMQPALISCFLQKLAGPCKLKSE